MTPPAGDLVPDGPAVPRAATAWGRGIRFFFLHLGTIVPIVVYFDLAARPTWGVPGALRAALALHLAYALLARAIGELKHFDLGLLAFWGLGVLATTLGPAPLAALYQAYSPALVFATFAVTALVPLLSGGTPFTHHFAARQIPGWQLRLDAVHRVNRVMAAFWVVVFLGAASLAAARPTDPLYTIVWPNLLVFLVGLPAVLWLPPLYLRLFPPGLPAAIEPLLMGMPLVFDPRAAGRVRASFQFHVSGTDAGDWCVHVDDGRCATFSGTAAAPDLVIRTPDVVWVRIARGEIDGGQALAQGLYAVAGDLALLPKLAAWFRPQA